MPAVSFWFSGSALYGLASLLLPIAIGIVGIRSVIPPSQLALWIVATTLLVVFGWFVLAKQNQENAGLVSDIEQIKKAIGIAEEKKQEIITPKGIVDVLEAQKAEALKSTRNNIPLFKALEGDASNPVGPIRINLVSVGGPVFAINYWISPADNKGAQDPQYWSIDQRKPLIPVVYPNSREWVRFLPPGSYLIEIDALTGHWNEYLSISREGERIKQSIKVVKDGSAIYTQETVL